MRPRIDRARVARTERAAPHLLRVGSDGHGPRARPWPGARASAAPTNLRVAVFINERYETGGGQALPNAGRISYVTIAAGAGWPWTGEAHDEAQAMRLFSALLELPQLGLLAVHVDAEPSPYPPDAGPTSQAEDRALFQRRLSGER